MKIFDIKKIQQVINIEKNLEALIETNKMETSVLPNKDMPLYV